MVGSISRKIVVWQDPCTLQDLWSYPGDQPLWFVGLKETIPTGQVEAVIAVGFVDDYGMMYAVQSPQDGHHVKENMLSVNKRIESDNRNRERKDPG